MLKVCSLIAAALAVAACASRLPWRRDSKDAEVNLVFRLERNLLYLPSATIDGHAGRYLLGTATSRTTIDPRHVQKLGASRDGYSLHLNERAKRRFRPAVIDLGGSADAIVGADVWGKSSITIDYYSGLVTLQESGLQPGQMTIFRYVAEPSVDVMVDGGLVSAIVDTSSPDTLTLPGASGRSTARVSIAGADFGVIDVGHANVARPRIGNRLLSRFLVTIDYGGRRVGLWRDPRN